MKSLYKFAVDMIDKAIKKSSNTELEKGNDIVDGDNITVKYTDGYRNIYVSVERVYLYSKESKILLGKYIIDDVAYYGGFEDSYNENAYKN